MDKNEILTLFERFNDINVLIIGDVMIDSYFVGKVDRISPEAPVPIVSVKSKENRLGGAANVALNLKALGATPLLFSIVGDDNDGKEFIRLLEKDRLGSNGIIKSKDRITTVKTRIIGNKNQVLRVDSEDNHNLTRTEYDSLTNAITHALNKEKIDVVIFQDYDKGTITKELIDSIVKVCKNNDIPTSVDPKKNNFKNYKGVSLFKPNLKELNDGLNSDIRRSDIEKIDDAIKDLNKDQNNLINFVTLSEHGVYIQSGDHKTHIPAHVRTIADVSGAGDTVISVAALCLALNQSIETIGKLANLAGGIVCETVGVTPINKDLLFTEAISEFT